MQGSALIITCGHTATETSVVAECLPALERLGAEWGRAGIQSSPLPVKGKGSREQGMRSAPKDSAAVHPRAQLGTVGKGRNSWLRQRRNN